MEHKTYPNSDRVGRCEFAAKTILGLALVVPCLVMATPRDDHRGLVPAFAGRMCRVSPRLSQVEWRGQGRGLH